jgi:hypothetical protein
LLDAFQNFLCAISVVPEIGGMRQGFFFPDLFKFAIDVKDASSKLQNAL